MRVYNPDTRSVQATFLGPTFGGPITQIVMFRAAASEGHFLAYSTAERVVGLLSWPLTGDPAETMGLIAHPGSVTGVAISYDGRKLMTIGESVCGGGGLWLCSSNCPGVLGLLECSFMAPQVLAATGAKVSVLKSHLVHRDRTQPAGFAVVAMAPPATWLLQQHAPATLFPFPAFRHGRLPQHVGYQHGSAGVGRGSIRRPA